MEIKFESPREEALQIALQTRKDILEGKKDAASIVRSCLVVTAILNKTKYEEWLRNELSGYNKMSDVPNYRNVNTSIISTTVYGQDRFEKFSNYSLHQPIHLLIGELQSGHEDKSIRFRLNDGKNEIVYEMNIRAVLNSIVDECLFMLDEIISELQYGGTIEYLMEEIRRNTDEKLTSFDKVITDEIKSLHNNLTSTNPADWGKVAHSSRKILSLVADKIFPPREDKYKMKDGREFLVEEKHYTNRLCAFLDQKLVGGERRFILSELSYLEEYIRSIIEYDQMGEHNPSLEKYHANMIAIHTYLVLSEILKHMS